MTSSFDQLRPTDPAVAQITLLTAQQVADAVSVNRATVWRWTQRVENPLPVVYAGGATRFRPDDVERWIEAETERRRRCGR